MARPALQFKNVASLVLALATSVFAGIASRRFDSQGKSWLLPAGLGAFTFLCQLGLIFVESKEEEELSLTRKGRMASERQFLDENEQLSKLIQSEIQAGNLESAEKWAAYRRDHYGK